MPRPGPSGAAALITEVVQLDSPPRHCREVVRDIIIAQRWAGSSMHAEELAERWESRFLARLRLDLTSCFDQGRPSVFEFNSASELHIQGSCFVEPGDSTTLRAAKLRRRTYAAYASCIASASPHDFEAVCRGILRLLGVADPALTPRTADEGIDFYGRLMVSSLLREATQLRGFIDTLGVWLVGQAKHYPAGRVATPEIRELVGSVELAKAGAYSRTENPFRDLAIRPCDPVFYLFFTTGTISSYGRRLLDASGVVGMDGESVAAFLADHAVGLSGDQFDEAELIRWIEQQKASGVVPR